ncbi:MAG: AI-2E family transporter [Candidatus Komeilibacteria bacterium]
MPEPKSNEYHLSIFSVLKVLLVIVAVAFAWFIRDILGLLFISIIFASAFNPWVDAWQRRHIPRGITLILIYLLVLSIFSGVIYLVAGPVSHEIAALANNFPQYYIEIVNGWDRLQSLGGGLLADYNLRDNINAISLPSATLELFGFVKSVFGSILAFLLVLVITFYLSVEERNMRHFIKSLTPVKHQSFAMQTMSRVQTKLGRWLRGQVILSVVIFVMTYAGLSILGVKYALILALLAGALEIVPYMGPILSAVPAIFLAFQQAPEKGLAVLILYFVVQQLENNLIVPKVMGKVTGLNPVIVLVAMLIGAKMAGIVGALLAIPVATVITLFINDASRNQPKAASE